MIPRRTLFVALALLAPLAYALQPAQLYEALGPDFDRTALERGEVVWTGIPEREANDRALTGVLMVRVRASLPAVMQALDKEPAMRRGQALAIDSEAGWSRVPAFLQPSLTASERTLLAGSDAQRHFNLDAAELARLQQAGSDAATLAKAWQGVLHEHFTSYRQHGLSSGQAIDSHGQSVQPTAQLAAATDSMVFLRQHFPQFIARLRDYPQGQDGLTEHFFVSIEQEEGRPVYSLKHQLVDIQPGHALIAERQFYVSHSLDSLQVTILCLPDGEYTVVGLLNHAFTGQVSGMGQAIAHRIGRGKVREKVEPMFEALQQRFAAAP